MSTYVIKVEAQHWWRERLASWLERREAPADCLSDLRTRKNTLSVYEVASEAEEKEVVAALALERAIGGKRDGLSVHDMARLSFGEELLAPLGIQVVTKDGTTRDSQVNKRHRDLVELTASQVARLAYCLLKDCAPRDYPKIVLLQEIDRGVAAGRISMDSLPQKVREQLNELHEG